MVITISFITAQSRNSIWCFGDSAGIDFRNISMPVPISTSLDSRGSCVSISDSVGNLLFYANTRANGYPKSGIVYNRNHEVMLNGDSLDGRGLYGEMVIIPKPGSSTLHFLFCIDVVNPIGLFYSIIDIAGDNGFGAVTSKNNQINNYDFCDAMTAVKHGNGRDWWVILKNYSDNADYIFYEYLVTPDTIEERIIQAGVNSNTNLGTLSFSKDGNKLAFVSFRGLIEIFDFDRCTGDFSNVKIVHPQWASNYAEYFGVAFSPNGNLLYISDSNEMSSLFQFDLTSSNIWASRETLATITTTRYAGGNLKLGPDNKIYWTCGWNSWGVFPYPYQDTMYHTENMNLSVINDPDVLGQGCNFSLFSFYLGGKRTYWGLPNNPDYELGALWGSACDSLTNGLNEPEESELTIYPNPFKDEIAIHSLYPITEALTIQDELGKIVFKERFTENKTFNLSFLPAGIYFFSIETEGKVFKEKFVKLK